MLLFCDIPPCLDWQGVFYCSKFACNAFYGGFGFGWCLFPWWGLDGLKRGICGFAWGCFSNGRLWLCMGLFIIHVIDDFIKLFGVNV
ncbi:hypothetical protein C0208_09500 [Moraxella catarrhalis]|nr:hypothetical protein [Moraxella catarrhalis]OBX43875.1 hypothetical protein A9Z57_04965 [Moraxella catarrhalis]